MTIPAISNEGNLIPEFDRHSTTLLAWPSRGDVWRQNGFPAQRLVKKLAFEISRFEKVSVFASPAHYDIAASELSDFSNVIEMSYDDIWLRDTCPFLLRCNGAIEAVGFKFNAWGGIYFPHENDSRVPRKISSLFNFPLVEIDFVLEGGAIDHNGAGLFVTTEECLLNPNRNPSLTKRDYEEAFKEHLGATHVIWLPLGLSNDETSGHVDEICRFVSSDHLFLAWTDNRRSEDYERVRKAERAIIEFSKENGVKLSITKVLIPDGLILTAEEAGDYYTPIGSLERRAGEKFAASYMNFVFVNGGIILPEFKCAEDPDAKQVFEEFFPDRSVACIESREFVLGGGSFHCITKDLPI